MMEKVDGTKIDENNISEESLIDIIRVYFYSRKTELKRGKKCQRF